MSSVAEALRKQSPRDGNAIGEIILFYPTGTWNPCILAISAFGGLIDGASKA
jgi:hypothetical protein